MPINLNISSMKHRLFFLLILIITNSFSYSQPALAWSQRYNGPPSQSDEAVSIAVDANGNSYVTGSAFAANGTLDIVTIKYNVSGQQLWLQSYNGTANDNDQGAKVILDNSGNVYVTGYSKGITTGNDITTIKYNSNGIQQWASTYNGAYNGYDQGAALVVDASGNVYVTGYETTSNNFTYDCVTLMYNSSGVQQWANIYNGTGNYNDQGKDILVDGSGNVYVTGPSDSIYNSFPNTDIVLLKYDNGGILQWRKVYASPTFSYDIPKKMCFDRNFNIIIVGYGGLTGQGDNFYTMKYSSAGVFQWFQSYNYAANTYEQPWDVITDSLNNVIVTGQGIVSTSAATNDYVTVKYDPAGIFQWVSRYNGPGNNNDWAYGIALDDSLNIFVTGSSKGSGTLYDVATVKYDQAGNEKYVLRFNNSAANKDDAGNDIAVRNGDIYIAGKSANLTNDDYITLRYSYSAVGIDEQQTEIPLLTAFPVPSQGELNFWVSAIDLNNALELTANITNSLGQNIEKCPLSIIESNGNRNKLSCDVTSLKKGIYFIAINNGEKIIGNARFIIN